MNKLISFLILFSFCILFAEVDEKEIYMKQANRLNLRRQYEKANEIYLLLLENYPEDYTVAEKLIHNYLITSKINEADEMLKEYKGFFPEIDYIKLKISILLAQGEVSNATNLSRQFLKSNEGKINYHKSIASVFGRYRHNDEAVKILLNARKTAKDDYLFTKELASDYESLKNFPNAIIEYLKHVEKNKSYQNYVLSRLKNILQEDVSQLIVIKEFTYESMNVLILEIYADCLAETGNFDEALSEYEKLDISKLLKFAENQIDTGNYEIALEAYTRYLEKIDVPNLVADTRIKIADIYIKQDQLDSAKNVLFLIYNDKKLMDKKYYYKTKANRLCREMLADIFLKQNASEDIILNYLEEAKDFSYSQKEKKEVNFKIIHFLIMTEHYEKSKEDLKEILKKEEPGTFAFKLGYFYSYLLAVMENDVIADSLLGELIINIPESELVNDALYLSILLAAFDSSTRDDFLNAFRKNRLYKSEEAVELILDIYNTTQNEEILFLAGDWAWQSGDMEQAMDIFSYEFNDPDIAEHAILNVTRLLENNEEKDQKIIEFLNQNPNSIFSPEFRIILSE